MTISHREAGVSQAHCKPPWQVLLLMNLMAFKGRRAVHDKPTCTCPMQKLAKLCPSSTSLARSALWETEGDAPRGHRHDWVPSSWLQPSQRSMHCGWQRRTGHVLGNYPRRVTRKDEIYPQWMSHDSVHEHCTILLVIHRMIMATS